MTIVRLQPVESSQIAAIGYHPETQTLAIRFHRGYGRDQAPGPLYQYSNVTADDYEAFRNAESLGRHFGQHIKPFADRYPYVKVDDGTQADCQRSAA